MDASELYVFFVVFSVQPIELLFYLFFALF